jgi:hypothetical protein
LINFSNAAVNRHSGAANIKGQLPNQESKLLELEIEIPPIGEHFLNSLPSDLSEDRSHWGGQY